MDFRLARSGRGNRGVPCRQKKKRGVALVDHLDAVLHPASPRQVEKLLGEHFDPYAEVVAQPSRVRKPDFPQSNPARIFQR